MNLYLKTFVMICLSLPEDTSAEKALLWTVRSHCTTHSIIYAVRCWKWDTVLIIAM